MYYVVVQREHLSNAYINGNELTHDVNEAQLFESIAAARDAIEACFQTVTWTENRIGYYLLGVFVIVSHGV